LHALALVAGKASTKDAIKANLKAVAAGGVEVEGYGVPGFRAAAERLKIGGDLDLDGVSGALDFDDNGDVKQAQYVTWKVKGGKLENQPTVLRFGFSN